MGSDRRTCDRVNRHVPTGLTALSRATEGDVQGPVCETAGVEATPVQLFLASLNRRARPLRDVMKTDNYKHIQRRRPQGGWYGLDLRNLGGTRVATHAGIPDRWFQQYLALLG